MDRLYYSLSASSLNLQSKDLSETFQRTPHIQSKAKRTLHIQRHIQSKAKRTLHIQSKENATLLYKKAVFSLLQNLNIFGKVSAMPCSSRLIEIGSFESALKVNEHQFKSYP